MSGNEDATMNECQTCGRTNDADANFCSHCGARLGAAAGVPGDNTGVIPIIGDVVGAASQELPSDAVDAIAALPEGNALLVVERGPNLGARFLLDQDVTTAGRSTHSDIFLDDITVSRHHVKFVRRDGKVVVEDQGSLNGTYVNRTLVDGTAQLRDGDEVQIGKFRMIFHTGGRGRR
ncbi:FHA domain-containing protein [Acidipropionibacterium timonense]|uniref:FHA domain-containing protein n=1 Tax=Acidipropionibacterium timonense TaxID=2161818 RepID=UPI001030E8A2|nr:FHA domain-containing protein [Acidipropionibacterium timonense]